MQKCSKGKLMALSSLSLGVSPAPFRCLLMFHDKSSQRFQRLRDFAHAQTGGRTWSDNPH